MGREDDLELVADFQATPISIDRGTLESLLDSANILRQDDTCVAGWIRILSIDEVVLIQEETTDREVLVRRMPSFREAEALVNDRLEIYERMWDGCGCKIHYFD